MAKKVTTTELELRADESLTSEHFVIDKAGDVVIKNQALAEALKTALPDAVDEETLAGVSVSISISIGI